jgi:integrase
MRKPNEEADRILQNSAPHVRPLFLFLMLTDCRISEAINLKWRDIDLAARWLVLRDTKNGTDRGVPIHRQLVEPLTGPPSAATKRGPVSLTDRGNPIKTTTVKKAGSAGAPGPWGVNGLVSRICISMTFATPLRRGV